MITFAGITTSTDSWLADPYYPTESHIIGGTINKTTWNIDLAGDYLGKTGPRDLYNTTVPPIGSTDGRDRYFSGYPGTLLWFNGVSYLAADILTQYRLTTPPTISGGVWQPNAVVECQSISAILPEFGALDLGFPVGTCCDEDFAPSALDLGDALGVVPSWAMPHVPRFLMLGWPYTSGILIREVPEDETGLLPWPYSIYTSATDIVSPKLSGPLSQRLQGFRFYPDGYSTYRDLSDGSIYAWNPTLAPNRYAAIPPHTATCYVNNLYGWSPNPYISCSAYAHSLYGSTLIQTFADVPLTFAGGCAWSATATFQVTNSFPAETTHITYNSSLLGGYSHVLIDLRTTPVVFPCAPGATSGRVLDGRIPCGWMVRQKGPL